MAKGALKFLMLRLIHQQELNGYQIISRVADLTGSRPSTGSIYPLLKSMEREGWIAGERVDGKTIYRITDRGSKKVAEFDEIREDHIAKIHESVSIANEAFEDVGHFVSWEHMEIISPLIHDAARLLQEGADSEAIRSILEDAQERLRELPIGGIA